MGFRSVSKSGWVGGLAEWEEGETTYLSVAFTYKLGEARARAQFARALGRRVIAGGPALFIGHMRQHIEDVAEIGTSYPDAIARHNPRATFASRGCPVGCWFCIVPAMEGREFTLLPDFPVRPILCDNNLSALPADYQEHIIRRYQAEGVKLMDANSGFEPITFTEEVYRRWRPLIRAGGGPWRFAYDERRERAEALRVMRMLREERQSLKRVYCLIGNEPFADCMARIEEILAGGCEPHVQPYMKLTATVRQPHVRFDWTPQLLADVARWANGYVWKRGPFSAYDRFRKSSREARYDEQQGLFV